MKAVLQINALPTSTFGGETASVPSPLRSVFEALIDRMQSHPEIANIAPLLKPSDYPGVQFSNADADIPVNIYLTDKAYVFEELDLSPDETVGAFLNATDLYGEHYRPDGFHIVVLCDADAFLNFVKEERELEMDPSDESHDGEYIRATLNNLTHELAHALEFIAHGHGLTTHAASSYEDGDFDEEEGLELSGFDYLNLDLVTGRWIREDMQDDTFANDKHAIDVMEQRVEAKGYRWIDDCLAGNEAETSALKKAFSECLTWVHDQVTINKTLSAPKF